MKLKNIVIVAALLLGLLAYILKFDIPSTEHRQAERKPFHDSSKSQLASIEIKRGDSVFKIENKQAKPALEKDRANPDQARMMDAVAVDEWAIKDLAYGKVDSANLNAVITQIMAVELGEPLPATDIEGDLSLYGLAKPEAEVVIARLDKYSTPKTLRFEFGKKSDFLAKRYVRYTRVDGSSDIFLTDDLLFFAVNKTLIDFRRKEPVEFTENELTQLDFSRVGFSTKLLLEKKPSKTPGSKSQEWTMLEPEVGSADQTKVSEALKNLKSFKVKEFLEGDRAQEKLQLFSNANLKAQLSKKDGAPLGVNVASEKEGEVTKTYFTISGVGAVFEAESNPTATLLQSPSSYRKTKFFDIDLDRVQSFDLSGSYVLGLKGEKKDGAWNIAEKAGDETFIRQWLSEVKELQAASFPDEAGDYGFATPNYKLTIKTENLFSTDDLKTIERVLVIGAPAKIVSGTPTTYFAAVDDLSEPFIISKAAMDKIIPKAEALVVLPTPTPTTPPSA